MTCETLFPYKHELKNEAIAFVTKPIRFNNDCVVFSKPLIVKKTTVVSIEQITRALLMLDRSSNLREWFLSPGLRTPKKVIAFTLFREFFRIVVWNGFGTRFWNKIMGKADIFS
jgi:hypothetical protein